MTEFEEKLLKEERVDFFNQLASETQFLREVMGLSTHGKFFLWLSTLRQAQLTPHPDPILLPTQGLSSYTLIRKPFSYRHLPRGPPGLQSTLAQLLQEAEPCLLLPLSVTHFQCLL